MRDSKALRQNGPVRRARASAPKVKTGCNTCKARRVKCDETKPSCMRCIKFGHKCDGYGPKFLNTGLDLSGPSRILVPKYLPPSADLLNGLEKQYFQLFCSKTAPRLGRYFDLSSWTQLVLQACQIEPSIRHAALAIGALNLDSPALFPENDSSTFGQHSVFQKFSSTTWLLQRDIAGRPHELRTTLLGCLLCLSFESFMLDHHSALNNIFSGLRLLSSWTPSLYQHHLEGPAHHHYTRTETTTFPYSNPEDVIQRAISSLEAELSRYADDQTANLHGQYGRYHSQETIDRMPQNFITCDQAQSTLEVVISRSMHWLRSTLLVRDYKTPSPPSTRFPSPFSLSSEIILNPGENDTHPPSPFLTLEPTLSEQLAILQEYSQWDSAFQPVLCHQAHTNLATSSDNNHNTILTISLLRLLFLSGYICISTSLPSTSSNPSSPYIPSNSNSPPSGPSSSRPPAGSHAYSSSSRLSKAGLFTKELTEMIGIARTLLSYLQPRQRSHQNQQNPFRPVFHEPLPLLTPLLTISWLHKNRVLRTLAIELLLLGSQNLTPNPFPNPNTTNIYPDILHPTLYQTPNPLHHPRSTIPPPPPPPVSNNASLLAKILSWLQTIEEEGLPVAPPTQQSQRAGKPAESSNNTGREGRQEEEDDEWEYTPSQLGLRCIKLSFDSELQLGDDDVGKGADMGWRGEPMEMGLGMGMGIGMERDMEGGSGGGDYAAGEKEANILRVSCLKPVKPVIRTARAVRGGGGGLSVGIEELVLVVRETGIRY